MGRLDSKVALISGAARGMGASHARAFVAEGAKVVIGDILVEEGEALAAELGDAAAFVKLDVTVADDWAAAVEVATSRFGKLNVLVNNAGITGSTPLVNMTLDTWNTMLNINLTGPMLGIQAAAPALIAGAPSSIVNISSIAGIIGNPARHAYVASKFGLRGLTKSVASELSSHNVRANSVHPGMVDTDMIKGFDIPSIGIPLERAARPDEVSNLVLFLASDESSYSTASEFLIDGGLISVHGAENYQYPA